MEGPRPSTAVRFLGTLLGGARGKRSSIRELQELARVVRFSALFGAMILVPVVLLAYLALASVNTAELAIDADFARRAETVSSTVTRSVSDTFDTFERAVRTRLTDGASPVADLDELSAHVRAAFHIRDGVLVGPFAPPTPAPPRVVPTRFSEDWRRAKERERAGDAVGAFTAYRDASHSTSNQGLAGEARLRAALILAGAGSVEVARADLSDLYADSANQRDEYGFRLRDLAEFHLGRLQNDDDARVLALSSLVDELLLETWTIGKPGEAVLARRALDELHGKRPPTWEDRVNRQLVARTTHLYWAERLYPLREFALLMDAQLETTPGRFDYFPSNTSDWLWTTIRHDDDLYVFAIDGPAVIDAMSAIATEAASMHEEISAAITTVEPPAREGTTRHNLGRHLGNAYWLQVGATDPEQLRWRKRSQTTMRIAIVVTAVFITLVGVVLAARMVGREFENARMKTDFAANVSHELRSPITQIRLKGEALQLDLCYDDADRHEHYDAIVRESERLSRLVDNVLDFAAIERGAKRYTFRAEDVGALIHRTVDSLASALAEAGLAVEVDIPDDLPVAWIDREAISQVMTNLVSNALKYGSDGAWIRVVARTDGEFVEIAVQDRGMGISKEDLPNIFDHFYRSSDARVRRRKGTGIGLAIVRYIVEAHGGSIRVDSELGAGTSFVITLPLEAPDGAGA